MSPRFRDGWVFSAREDLAVFAGPLLLAAALCASFAATGRSSADVPPWAFLLLVVGCDVAEDNAVVAIRPERIQSRGVRSVVRVREIERREIVVVVIVVRMMWRKVTHRGGLFQCR